MEFLKPIQEKRHYYEEHPKEVDKILLNGSRVARKQAKEVMKRVKKSMKIDYFEEEI